MKRIFVPTNAASDWQRLLAKPKLHWKKGKSAMTAAAAWEAAEGALPSEIAELLQSSGDKRLAGLRLLAAIPEWEVELEGGDTASHTDVLVLARNDVGLGVIAVEAKVDEDFGPLLKDKRAEPSLGQSNRLSYLHSVLGIAALADSVRYQLVHRTASALLTAREFHAHVALMLVQSFGDRASLHQDFNFFCEAMGAKELAPGIRLVPSMDRPALFLGWCNGDRRFLTVELPSAV